METETYILPEHWACALFYGDDTGLDDDDQAALDAWVKDHHHLGDPLDMTNEGSFWRFHDARPYGVLACNCADYVFPVILERAQ